MNTLRNTIIIASWLLSLVVIFALLMMMHPVVHVLADEIIPVH